MRSSIACVRCRRSKVKCVNNGVSTVCRACENSGRDCTYPPPLAAQQRRRESSLPRRPEGTSPGASDRKSRPRKHTQPLDLPRTLNQRNTPRPLVDALNPHLLTTTLWSELFDIFQLHYSADLPFLHPPTFLKPLRNANVQYHVGDDSSKVPSTPDSTAAIKPPGSDAFLLAFLALTSRFHTVITAYHSPSSATRVSNPLIAAEYYATAAQEKLYTAFSENGLADLDQLQATLMLGLHHWGMCRGAKAWVEVGTAMRAAQAMGLQYELDLDDEPLSKNMAVDWEAERKVLGVSPVSKTSANAPEPVGFGQDEFIQQEIRRRTFWSCFIMDRYLSSGKYRPQMLHARELRIQLPASERSFLFAEKVRTLMLADAEKLFTSRAWSQSDRDTSVMLDSGASSERGIRRSTDSILVMGREDERARLENGADEGLLSRYIRILEIYGKVVKWSCAGGRRTEEYPPWDERCEYYRLHRMCHDFNRSLPRQHALTPQNTQAHISMKTSTPYILLHTVHLLCHVMLDREYVPFLPIRCSKPQGPLDPPLFPSEKYKVPPTFWEDSARECFKSARQIIDLVRTCQEWDALVETPIVGFAVYTVAFVGVYCINFPWMDPDGYMCTNPSNQHGNPRSGPSKGFEAARKALEVIGQMKSRLYMADGWFRTINRMHKYLRKMKSDHHKNRQANDSSGTDGGDSPESTRHLSLREGGDGGGLDEYRLLERSLMEFGNLEDQDVKMLDLDERSASKPYDAVYDESSAEPTVKSEDYDRAATASNEPIRSEGPWNAINTTSAPRPADVPILITNGPFRSFESFPGPPPRPISQTQVNSYKPSHAPRDVSNAPRGPPSLTSPASRTASTPSAMQSPAYDPVHNSYGSWASHHQSAYPLMPAAQPYASKSAHFVPPQATPLTASQLSAYPPSASNDVIPLPSGQQTHGLPHNWTSEAPKEGWVANTDAQMGAYDVAAFVDGDDMGQWATMAVSKGYDAGWLSTIWEPMQG